jgi:hypothetical protein
MPVSLDSRRLPSTRSAANGQFTRPARESPFLSPRDFSARSNQLLKHRRPHLRTRTAQTGAEELIAEKAPSCDALDDEDVASNDGRKMAWRCRTNSKWTVLVNGVSQGRTFDEVRSLTFSPDSQHVAFAARSDKRWMVVEDGTERPERMQTLGPCYTATTADGWRLLRSP